MLSPSFSLLLYPLGSRRAIPPPVPGAPWPRVSIMARALVRALARRRYSLGPPSPEARPPHRPSPTARDDERGGSHNQTGMFLWGVWRRGETNRYTETIGGKYNVLEGGK